MAGEILYGKMVEAVEKAKAEIKRKENAEAWARAMAYIKHYKEEVIQLLNELFEPFMEQGWSEDDIKVSLDLGWYDDRFGICLKAPNDKRVYKTVCRNTQDMTKEEFKDYEHYLKEGMAVLSQKKKQEKAFRESPAYDLYNWRYHEYLNDKDHKRYEELKYKLYNEVLSDEELEGVIKELEELYEKAKFNKEIGSIEKLKKENEELRKRVSELEETIELLRELIAEELDREDVIEWLMTKRKAEIEEEVKEEAENLVPELFEDC